jgi:hypothetical protein
MRRENPLRDHMPDWFEDYLKRPDIRVWMVFFFRILHILLPLWILIGILLFIFLIRGGLL